MNDLNDQDAIGRHLAARASAIHLPRTDVSVITERAAARTARRRKATFGVTAAALLVGGTVAVVTNGGGDHRTPLATSPDAVVASPLEWTVVDPTTGLGSTSLDPVQTDDGSLYSISTQPGAINRTDVDAWAPRTLYTSTDGSDWQALDLPDDLYASALAADGSRLYAVGTGPTSNAEVPLRLATSDDGGTTWSDPVDLPGLDSLRALGPEVGFSPPTVAVHDGTTVVTFTATAFINVDDRLPAGIDDTNGYQTTPEGVEVFGTSPCDGDRAVIANLASGAATDPRSIEARGTCAPPVVATLTWDQLGVSPELAALVTPQLHVFASTDDGSFAEVPAPVSAVGSSTDVVATDDGFTMAVPQPTPPSDPADTIVPATSVFTSPDGTTWTRTADIPDLSTVNLGVVGGQVMLAGMRSGGQSVIDILGPQGVVATVDPADAVGQNGDSASWYGVSGFGPMGWATVLFDSQGTPKEVVHSDATGQVLAAEPIPADLAAWGTPVGLTVTADAITVRFTQNLDGDPTTVEPQRLLVGTPRG